MLEFDIKGYADTRLTPVIYVIQGAWCLLVFLPLAFIVRCWQRFAWTRNIRTAFTLYLSGIDSLSRLIFLVYYLLRLISIYRDGLWMVENEDGTQSVIDSRFAADGSSPDECAGVNASLPRCSSPDARNTISRENCLTFALFLYWATTWPMSSVLLLQIHALAASTISDWYTRIATIRFCIATMLATFVIDLTMGVVAQRELAHTFVYGGGDEPEIMDACKFEYFSRLSILGSWYVFGLLTSIGVLTLVQLAVSCANRRRRRHFVNPVANSPVHGWTRMTKNERRLTVTIMTCSIASFVLFLLHFGVYLVEGNSEPREVLSIAISVFAFFGPIELMWFNVDLRRAVFVVLFGDHRRRSSKCSAASLFGYDDDQETSTTNGGQSYGTNNRGENLRNSESQI